MKINIQHSYMKAIAVIVAFLFISEHLLSQTIPPPKIVSPNATAMDKFTEIPVNLFTGTPDISFPLYTLKYGNIQVPISLDYHPGSVRPAQQPGWVGLGWNLKSYGIITRNRRGYWDDFYGDPGTPNGPVNSNNSYYPVYGNSVNFPQGSGSELANASDWDSPSRLYGDYSVASQTSPGINDVQADEFSFDVMGYSGTFYYSGPTLGWQVVSRDNIKVSLNGSTGFMNATQIISSISEFSQFQQYSCNQCLQISPSHQVNQFNGFTITVPDGTQFEFGGPEATEFYSTYHWVSDFPHDIPYLFIANAWLLTKIVDPQKNEVDFAYQRTFPTCQLNFSHEDHIFSSPAPNCSQTLFGNVDTKTHDGTYQWPMYLSKITSPNETVAFNISHSPSMPYANNTLLYHGGVVSGNPGDKFDPSVLNGDISNLKWEQLNSIDIRDKLQLLNRQFVFTYDNSIPPRLILKSFSENDNHSMVIKKYSFAYNNIQGLPNDMDGDKVDHWGFYNGNSVSGQTLANVLAIKETNPALVTTGLLNQISYPTGGFTQLSWEAHDYGRVVNVTRTDLDNVANAYAGGNRIKEIKGFDKSGLLLSDKSFYYKQGYSAGAIVNQLKSSGILNGPPRYTFVLNNRSNPGHSAAISFTATSLNSAGVYSYNGQNSYLGYDEVVVLNEDGSYTKHFFTSYGQDINNVFHRDILPTGSLGWDFTQDVYFPMSSLELERGKPTGTVQYTPTNLLVQKTNFVYRNDPGRFNNYIKLIDFGGEYACNSNSVIFASARKQFSYDYYPISKTISTYDKNGANPVVTNEAYTYNANNLIQSKTNINSKGETLLTNYKYPTDYTDATSLAMVNAHIISPVIETSVTVNTASGQFQQALTHVKYFTPSNLPGVYLPQNVQMQIGNNAIETRQQIYQYDNFGNVEETSKDNDKHEVDLWGYNGEYLVAKIIGSTYSAVSAIVTQSQIDLASISDANLRDLMKTLRNSLSNTHALVTSYTYSPLTGITSETDAQGRSTYYEYDSFQRLKVIKDFNYNIVKTYDYSYGN